MGRFNLLAAGLCLIYVIAFSVIAINRYWQYDVFYYDFGIFDQAIWNVSRFKPPIIEHFIIGGKWIFADHFNPSIFLFSPLYWLTNKSEVILIAQSMSVGIAGFLIFKIGQLITKNKIFSFGVMISFLLFVGVQNALITDFHEMTVATVFFVACIYAFLLKKTRLYFLFLLIVLGFKESNFAICSALSATIIFLDKKNLKVGIATLIISLLWGIIAIKFIIPTFSQGQYIYNTPIPDNPVRLINSFFDNPTKQGTLFFSFLNFGFLPIFSLPFYPLIFTDFASRFYPSFLTLSWGLGFHYSVMTGSILALATIFSHKYLRKYIPNKVFSVYGILLIVITLFLHRFILHGPLGLATNKSFYTHTKNFTFLNNLVDKVPPNVTVMTHNNLASHFTHQDVRLLRDKCKTCRDEHYRSVMPDYIVIDKREGQNPNNYYGVGDLGIILNVIRKDKDYKIFYQSGDQFILKRI